jgi:hypothetical protein
MPVISHQSSVIRIGRRSSAIGHSSEARMSPAQAQTIRRLGLMIETACLFGLMWLWRKKIPLRPVGGVDQLLALKIGLALGFALWLFGTATIYWPKRSSGGKPPRDSD